MSDAINVLLLVILVLTLALLAIECIEAGMF